MVTGIFPSPPRYLPSFLRFHLSAFTLANSHLLVLLTNALALSLSSLFQRKKSLRIKRARVCMHSVRLQPTTLSLEGMIFHLLRHREGADCPVPPCHRQLYDTVVGPATVLRAIEILWSVTLVGQKWLVSRSCPAVLSAGHCHLARHPYQLGATTAVQLFLALSSPLPLLTFRKQILAHCAKHGFLLPEAMAHHAAPSTEPCERGVPIIGSAHENSSTFPSPSPLSSLPSRVSCGCPFWPPRSWGG